MKVKELLAKLKAYESADDCRPEHDKYMDWEVVVLTSEGGFGAHPHVKTKSVSAGFDWEHGLMMISPEQAIWKKPPKEKKNG